MATAPQNIHAYFPNIRIRTMRKDLETLQSGGGTISEPERVIEPEPPAFAQPEGQSQPVHIIEPPKLESAPSQIQKEQKPRLEDFVQQSYPKPVAAAPLHTIEQTISQPQQKQNVIFIYALLGMVGFVALGSVGYWVLYPRLAGKLFVTPLPSTGPVVSVVPSESPAAQNPMITMKVQPQSTQIFTLHVSSTSSAQFFGTLQSNLTGTFPPIGTTMFFSTMLPDETYVTSKDMLKLFVPKVLPSFQATLDAPYALFAYWYKTQTPAFGLVFSIAPDKLTTAKAIMAGWETARIEQDFANLFFPATLVSRQGQNFIDVMVSGFPARMFAVSRDGETTNFIYGFINNDLLITTDAKAFEVIAKIM